MTKKTNISLAKKGMNRSTYPSQLEQQEYTFAINANAEDLDGNTFSLSNEHSNILASKFKDGFKVIGFKNDVGLNKTFFFLTNPTTHVSEFGYILNIKNLQDISDIEVQCDTCDYKNLLSDTLETVVQTPYQTYVTLLSDCVDNLCFNFNVNYPIKKIEIKTEKTHSTIFFTDFYNPPRYIQLDNLDIYSYTGEIICSDDSNLEPTCLACNKMKMFRDFSVPQIIPQDIMLGGRLKMGVYEFLIAYSDELGNELSDYYSITNPISIFDSNNNILEQENLADRTNFSIKLKVTGLDKNYTHYKVAVIQTADINGATSTFVEGIHTINDETVIYATEENKQRIDFVKLSKQNIYVKKWEGLTQSNNYLFGYGIEVEKEMNLQPVVNLMGQFLRWQTHIATEDLYTNGVNTSLYLGYNRDETVPFGIRFYTESGYRTSVFPLIGRQATEDDLEIISPSNKDRQSIESNLTACVISDRSKRWQFYNTAVQEGSCTVVEEIPTISVTEDIEKICYIENIATSEDGEIIIELTEPFTGLEDFIEDNKDECSTNPDIFGASNLCDLLDVTNYPETCSDGLFEDNCDSIELVSEEIQVTPGSIEGEVFEGIEKNFPDDYAKIKKPNACNIYKYDGADIVRDTLFEHLYMYLACMPTIPSGCDKIFDIVKLRDYNATNETCSTAEILNNIETVNTITQGYYHNYYGGDTTASLQTTTVSIGDGGQFTDKIHKGALWFKGVVADRTSFIFEVSKLIGVATDGISNGVTQSRVSIYNKCNATAPLHSEIYDITLGVQYKFDIIAGGFNLDDGVNPPVFIAETNLFPGGFFYVAIDNGIVDAEGVSDPNDIPGSSIVPRKRLAVPAGCFSIVTRDIEFEAERVSWDSITFRKKSIYKATCTYEQPVVQKCKAFPFKYGKFAYTESTETYPDNQELFDSKILLIKPEDIPDTIKEEFEETFMDTIGDDGEYILNDNTTYNCKPIRHFRMPDNKVSPFMYQIQQTPFNNDVIYPLGVTIDENLINSFLDIAFNNNLITDEQRKSIVKYEIVRGDISNDRSIQSSGLLYDMRNYSENGKPTYYSNYPYNDLGGDKMNPDSNQTALSQNSKFTFHSPETDYYKSSLPSEMSVQGYMFGKSVGNVSEVKGHPKWVILSNKAKDLATKLAGLEVSADVAIRSAATLGATGNVYQIFGGVAGVGLNVGGIATAIAAYAADAIANISKAITDFGRYRYEWLKIFRDLGQQQNFAAYYFSTGHYNYLKPLQEEEQYLRSLNVAKKIKGNKLVIIDETSGERITINNIDREHSLFLSTGVHPIEYVTEYFNYDNNSVDNNNSSITFSSENSACRGGRSKDIIRNIASPYVALKNFIPSQYGNINSVKWNSTGYMGDLLNPKEGCLSIFGGDTYISRHTLKRKLPLFLTDAMDIASMTPFNYSFYKNIGADVGIPPRFYCDFELNIEYKKSSALFPDIDSNFNFDCYNKSGNYITSPSKFYLYYYGVPSFLCETRINTNYRYGKTQPEKNFYPEVGDIEEWTQEKNVSIKKPNHFFYNDSYSKSNSSFGFRTLPDSYSKEIYDKTYDKPNGVMYSLPDNEENNLNEPWLIYRPLDFYEFPTDFGKLKDLRGIESSQVLCRFENQTAIYNSVDVTVETGQALTPGSALGNGGIFARRPVTFSETDLGYMGSQTSEMISCEFGHFFADAKRGYVFKINAGGKGVEEISSYVGGKPSGLSHWFKEHLPFKILNSNIEGIDLDNAMNGIGLSMGWDSRFKRVFLTKKDYIVTNSTCLKYEKEIGFYTDCNEGNVKVPVSLTDLNYFKDVSWTIAFSPVLNSWLSYYDFHPNYYINHNNYFQTGINNTSEELEFGLWSHIITNKSYQVFYGKKYDFVIEFPDKNVFNTRTLNSVHLWTEARRYHDKHNYAYSPDLTFNKAVISNNNNHSGELNLVPQKNNFVGNKNYPKTNSNNTQDILISNKDNFRWSFDYIFNRVKNNVNNEPNWLWDENQIRKTTNNKAVSFVGKKVLEYLTGDYFLVGITYNKDSRFKMIHKWSTQDYDI